MSDISENTLMLGNGFVRSIYTGTPSWESLYSWENTGISLGNYTFLYEVNMLSKYQSDNQYKRKLIDKLRSYVQSDKINANTNDLDEFGKYLEDNHIQNIISTNFDKGIENILCDKNGYIEQAPEDITVDAGEKIYSIRRNIRFIRDNHSVRLWKIHGDIDSLASVSLGFDQYCGALAKMKSYINGEYKSSSGVVDTIPIQEKCTNDQIKPISWIDLFFKTNVYIAGFGMDFSEIDIWWLLNKRYRLIKQGADIHNEIVFLYNEYDTGDEYIPYRITSNNKTREVFKEKIIALEKFGVKCKKMEAGSRFIQSLFMHIDSL